MVSHLLQEFLLKSWNLFCPHLKIHCIPIMLNHVLNFLHSCQIRNVGYSVLNTIRSMLSSFVEIDCIEVGKHPVICRYIKGAYNMNPSLPKHNFTWDVGTVVKYLINVSSVKLFDLSKKLATLTAILCGQRPKEILALIDIRNLSFEENFWLSALVTFYIGEIKFPWYRENDEVCVFTCMKEYVILTANLRGNITRLFITTTKPYKIAS